MTADLGQVPAIRAEGLSKRFWDVAALADLNLEVAPGEVLGYLGPNGAGKTTTIRLLLGLIRPTGAYWCRDTASARPGPWPGG